MFQPLIPTNFDYETNVRHDRFMISAFQGPVFGLSSTLLSKVETRDEDIRMRQARAMMFVAVSYEVFKLLAEFGMVLPIMKEMKTAMPTLFDVLVPVGQKGGKKIKERELFSQLAWMKRNDVKPSRNQNEGWTNIPLIMWVIGFLISRDYVALDGHMQSTLSAEPATEWTNCAPRLKVGEVFYTLYEFILFLLFDVTRMKNSSPEVIEFRELINEKLKDVSKKTIYDGMQNWFELDVTAIYGKEKDTSQGEQKREGRKKERPTRESSAQVPSVGHASKKPKEGELEGSGEEGERNRGRKRQTRDDNKEDKASSKKMKAKLSADSEKKASTEQKRRKKRGLKMPPVRSIHLEQPPDYINTDHTSWYWDFSDSLEGRPWYHHISLQSVNDRLEYNLCKLLYTMIALEYSRQQNKNDGQELYEILAGPILCDIDEEKEWDEALLKHKMFGETIAEEGGTITQPALKVSPESQSFFDYFKAVIESYEATEGTLHETDRPHIYWKRQDVDCWETFDRNTVLAVVHNLKCSVLFDSICRNVFETARKRT